MNAKETRASDSSPSVRRIRPRHLVAPMLLLAATVLVFATTPPVEEVSVVGVAASLPTTVGAYAGIDVLFCQNEQCAAHFTATALDGGVDCPICGSDLELISPGERQALPRDVTILRKQYVAEGRPAMTVSVVVSGEEPKGIHRPQQCLPAQGNTIEQQRVRTIQTASGPLHVMQLTGRHRVSTLAGDRGEVHFTFAYWFVSPQQRTPHFIERLLLSARERILHGRNYRWAYVAVLTDSSRGGQQESWMRVQDFIAELAPKLEPGNDA